MKPAPFDYVAARDLGQALAALDAGGAGAKVLAGGQSLMPMLNFRLLGPSVLVDINGIPGLDGVEDRGDHIRVGALVRHRVTASHPLIRARLPILTAAMAHVAHVTVRNRGAFAGSLCHADPAAELPMLALLLGATLRAASARSERRVAASDFFVSALTTALEPGEIVTAVELPVRTGRQGWGFEEYARRQGDFALAAVGVIFTQDDEGRARQVRIAMTGVGDTPLRATAAEARLEGVAIDERAIAEAVEAVRAAATPSDDLHASADYRRHLVGVLAGRALRQAKARADSGEASA